MINSILYGNKGLDPSVDNWSGGSLSYCCATPLPSGSGNISADPMFKAPRQDDYRLDVGSPCINAGTNLPWMAGAMSLSGTRRIGAGRVDMGAYEKYADGSVCILR